MFSTPLPLLSIHAKQHQQILIDWQGYIIESSDSIFSTYPERHRPLMEWSCFISSIFPSLQSLKLDSPEVFLPRIHSITNFLEGFYDCSFMRVEWAENQHIIVWNILDLSEDISKIKKNQQVFNEAQIKLASLIK